MDLPKATIQQFVRDVTKNELRCSNEFIMDVMTLAKEYINRVSNESNKICLEQGKKTISAEFFYSAIQRLQLQDQIDDLRKIESEVIEETTIKNQNKAKFHDEEHLKQLEEQQRILFEHAKTENQLQFQQQQDQLKETYENGENTQRRKLNISFFEQIEAND